VFAEPYLSLRLCHHDTSQLCISRPATTRIQASYTFYSAHIMVLGRVFHYAFDALAVSAILAGVKKSTGYAPATNLIPDSSIKTVADSYFAAGETVYNIIAGQAVTSEYFKRS